MILFINFFSSFFDFFKFLYFVLSLGCMCSISACYQAIFSVLRFFTSYYPSQSLSPFVVLPRFSCSFRIFFFFIIIFRKFFFSFLFCGYPFPFSYLCLVMSYHSVTQYKLHQSCSSLLLSLNLLSYPIITYNTSLGRCPQPNFQRILVWIHHSKNRLPLGTH